MQISPKVDALRLQIVSDLHLEFLSQDQVVEVADRVSYRTSAEVLLLAGDICSLSNNSVNNLYTFLDFVNTRYNYILYVLGNHEYYGTSREEVSNVTRKIVGKIPNIFILENSSITINNVTFYGTTLWFEETVEAGMYRHYLNDYRCIKDFTPDLWCRKALFYIRNISDDENKKVLITHHVPHSRFISEKYVGNKMNCFYLNEIGKYLDKFDLVTFGHSHDSVDYQFSNRTKAISNPRGYVEDRSNEGSNSKFQYQLIVGV